MPEREGIPNLLTSGGLDFAPAPVNILGAYRDAASTADGIWKNRAWQAHQAAGEAYQQATNPLTGEVDPARAQAIMAAMGGRASLAAQGSATTGQALQQAQQNRSIQGQAHVNQTLTSLLTLGDDQMTPQTIKAGLDQLVAARSITPQDEQAAIAGLPPNATAQQIRQYLVQHTVANLAGPEAAAKILPTQGPDITTPSNGLQGTLRAPLLSPTTPGAIGPSGGEVPQGAGPGSDNEVMTITNPDGSLTTDTKAGLKASGKISPTTGQPMPGYMVPPPKASGGSYVGKPNPLLGGLPNPAEIDTPAPAAGKTSGGTTVKSGTVEQNKIDQDQYNQRTVAYNNNEANLIANYKEAYILGTKIATGKGLENLSAARSAIVSLGRAVGYDTGSMDTADQARAELDKVLNQILITSPGAGRSDASLGTTGAATPHLGMNTNAMLNQIKILYGQAKQQNAAMLEHDPETKGIGFQEHNRTMMNTTARDGFAADLMTPDEIDARVKRLGGDTPAAKAFKRSVVANMNLYKAAPGSGLEQ